MNPFFDELFRHWNVRLRPGTVSIPIEVDDSDDESTDFTNFLAVKTDPYDGPDPHDEATAVKLEKQQLALPVVAEVEEVAGHPRHEHEKPEVAQTIEDSPVKQAAPSPATHPEKVSKHSMLGNPLTAEEVENRIMKVKYLAHGTVTLIFLFQPAPRFQDNPCFMFKFHCSFLHFGKIAFQNLESNPGCCLPNGRLRVLATMLRLSLWLLHWQQLLPRSLGRLLLLKPSMRFLLMGKQTASNDL